MSLKYTLSFLLLALVAHVRSDAFVKPPNAGNYGDYSDNSVYKENNNISMEWSSDLDHMNVVLYQVYPMGGEGNDTWSYNDTIVVNSSDTTYVWNATFSSFSTNFSTDEAAVFYAALYETGNTSLAATSHYFNVTKDEETTTTTTLTSSSTAATATGDSTSQAAAATTSSDSSSSGLSTGAVAGIAVGATLGGIAVLAGIGFFIWKRFHKGSDGTSTTNQGSPMTEYKPDGVGTNVYYPQTYQQDGWKDIHEAPNTPAVQEAGGQPVMRQEAPGLRDLHEAP